MPITKQAIKKLRRDRSRTVSNNALRKKLHHAIKQAKKGNTPSLMSKAFSSADKAVKQGLIHKNKAKRIKSRLAKRSVA